MKTVEQRIRSQLAFEGKEGEFTANNLESNQWTNINLWVEMCMTVYSLFSSQMSPETMEKFMQKLYEKRETLCGEYLSYLHPHIVAMEKGYKECIFFAVTTYEEETFHATHPDAMENLKRLQEMNTLYSLQIVGISNSGNIATIEKPYNETKGNRRGSSDKV